MDAMLLEGEYVHTFTNPAVGLILGTDVERKVLLEMVKIYGAELAGEMATSMKHGIVVYDGKTTMFCETKNDAG